MWILDSGSSSHIANDEKLFKKIIWNETKIGIAKKNQKMKTKGINTIEIENILIYEYMNNVFIPELNKTLLSVSAIIKSDMIYLLIN